MQYNVVPTEVLLYRELIIVPPDAELGRVKQLKLWLGFVFG